MSMGPGWVRIIGQKSCDTVPLIQKEYKLSFLPTLCPPLWWSGQFPMFNYHAMFCLHVAGGRQQHLSQG